MPPRALRRRHIGTGAVPALPDVALEEVNSYSIITFLTAMLSLKFQSLEQKNLVDVSIIEGREKA